MRFRNKEKQKEESIIFELHDKIQQLEKENKSLYETISQIESRKDQLVQKYKNQLDQTKTLRTENNELRLELQVFKSKISKVKQIVNNNNFQDLINNQSTPT